MDRSSESTDVTRVAAQAPAVNLDDRLLAESVRAAEALGASMDDQLAVVSASQVDSTFEQRIVMRAKLLPKADDLRHALRQIRTVAGWIIIVAIILSLVAGAGAARTALGGERETPVIVLPVLGGLLGVQTLLLIAWLAMWFIQPRGLSSASLGGLVLHGVQYLARLGTRSADHLATVQAFAGVSMHSSIARWKTGAISHAIWTAFNIGCIVLLLSLLSTRSYTFGWETTILPEDVYAPLIQTIGWLPTQIGFTAPTAEQIASSQWSGSGDPPYEARNAWSSLLVGCMVTYGALPRLVLLVLSVLGMNAAQRRFRLDTSKPGYVRLRHRLEPESQSIGVVDADDSTTDQPNQQAGTVARHAGGNGPTPVVGIEIDQPSTGWPPNLPGIELFDLGRLESRVDRDAALRTLRDAESRPPRIVVVCALTTTPDRGVETLLHQIRESGGAPIALLLTAGQTLRERSDQHQLVNRVRDWHDLASRIGIDDEQIIELDLDHVTDASMQSAAALLIGETEADSPTRQIEPAFELIATHCRNWTGPPNEPEQLSLHTEIARLYRHQTRSWMGQVQAIAGKSADVIDQAQQQARRSMSLLPGNLRATPIWTLAGATAGAIGCLAVASLIAPAALAALPGWAAVGGGLTTVIHAARQLGGGAEPDSTESPSPDSPAGASDAIAAATLFALLLELQGRSESTITAVLEQTLSEDDPPPQTCERVEQWLDGIRHQFDLALAARTGGAP